MSQKTFFKKLDQAWRVLAGANGGQAGGVVYVAIDQHDDLRERLGFRGLIELDEQLRLLVREHFDTVPAMFAPGLTRIVALVRQIDAAELEKAASELFRALQQHDFPCRDESISVTVSVAACPLDLRFSDPDQMLAELLGKGESLSRDGGNQVAQIYPSSTARQVSGDDRQILVLLIEALRKDGLQVVFQPLMSARGDVVRNFQMLPRLRTSDGDLLVAAEFLPVATKAGLLGTIDRWMIRHAVHMIGQQGDECQFRLFISQSSELLTDVERRKSLARQMEKAPDIRGNLVLDFQLGDAMTNLKGTESMLRLVNRYGIEICFSRFDDCSNIDFLVERFRCDYLRLAPEFVKRLGEDENLAHEMDERTEPIRQQGTRLIAPMIEDAATMASLWKSSVDYLQGNMIQEAEEFLRLS